MDAQLAKYKAQISKMRPGPSQDAVKRRALVILKQKRMYEGQREQLYQQSFNVENANFAAQNIKDNITQVQAMKAAHKDFKKAFKAKELDIDYIDDMQDDMMDMMEMTNEINESLGRGERPPPANWRKSLSCPLPRIGGRRTLTEFFFAFRPQSLRRSGRRGRVRPDGRAGRP